MKLLINLSFVLLIVAAFSCNSSSKKTSDSSIKMKDSMSEMSADNEVMACQHASKIYWRGTKPTGEHSGIIKLKGGNYFVEDNELVGGEFIIDMNSILCIDIEDEEKNAKLVDHLKSDDFFVVDSFPEGKFVITAVNQIKDDAFSHEIKGDLTLKGISNAIVFKANIRAQDGVVSATSEEFSINRTKWGVNYKSKSVFKELKDKFIDDEFFIKIDAHSM